MPFVLELSLGLEPIPPLIVPAMMRWIPAFDQPPSMLRAGIQDRPRSDRRMKADDLGRDGASADGPVYPCAPARICRSGDARGSHFGGYSSSTNAICPDSINSRHAGMGGVPRPGCVIVSRAASPRAAAAVLDEVDDLASMASAVEASRAWVRQHSRRSRTRQHRQAGSSRRQPGMPPLQARTRCPPDGMRHRSGPENPQASRQLAKPCGRGIRGAVVDDAEFGHALCRMIADIDRAGRPRCERP